MGYIVHIREFDSEVAAIRIQQTQIVIEGPFVAVNIEEGPDTVQIEPGHTQAAEFTWLASACRFSSYGSKSQSYRDHNHSDG